PNDRLEILIEDDDDFLRFHGVDRIPQRFAFVEHGPAVARRDVARDRFTEQPGYLTALPSAQVIIFAHDEARERLRGHPRRFLNHPVGAISGHAEDPRQAALWTARAEPADRLDRRRIMAIVHQ